MNNDDDRAIRLLVITPTLGRSAFLDAAIDSVRALPFAVTHVISCPADQAAPLQARFPEAIAVPDAGRAGGIYGALNAGLAAAPTGWDWFTYINDDDRLAPGFTDLVRRHCRPDRLGSVAYGDIMNIDADGRPLGRMTIETDPRRFAALVRQGISPTGQQGVLAGVTAVRALVGYDEKYRLCADLDFLMRACAAGYPVTYYPLAVGEFRIQPGQLSGDVNLTRREMAAIVGAHFPAPPSALAMKWARLGFRLRNAPRYYERWRALGKLSTSNAMLGSPS